VLVENQTCGRRRQRLNAAPRQPCLQARLRRFSSSSPTYRSHVLASIICFGSLEFAARDISESLSVELSERRHQPVVGTFVQQSLRRRCLKAALSCGELFAVAKLSADVEDLLLAFLHPRDVLSSVTAGSSSSVSVDESQQVGDRFAIRSLRRAFLQHFAKSL
jgi:hypothetical protein